MIMSTFNILQSSKQNDDYNMKSQSINVYNILLIEVSACNIIIINRYINLQSVIHFTN